MNTPDKVSGHPGRTVRWDTRTDTTPPLGGCPVSVLSEVWIYVSDLSGVRARVGAAIGSPPGSPQRVWSGAESRQFFVRPWGVSVWVNDC